MVRGKTLIISFRCDYPVQSRGNKLRGFLGKLYPEELLLHHHEDDKHLRYSYPLIQCKVIKSNPFVVGIDEGIEFVRKLFSTLERFKIEDRTYIVVDKKAIFNGEGIKISCTRHRYTFLTPWLALNEKNYQKYQRMGTRASRKKLLENVMVGNIISMSKGLGYTVPGPIEAEILTYKEIPTSLKGNPMLGFWGEFEVNFKIPDYLGIGKSVSRGFGTVRRKD